MNLKSQIESVLFLAGEGIDLRRLEKLLGVKKAAIESAIDELTCDYAERGIRLMKKDTAWQLGTAPENSEILANMVKSEFSEELSRASLEVLSIIAYKGPLMRAKIEYIRGINSTYSVRSLLLRGLIERIDNPKDTRSYLYRISFDFLKYLGIENCESLPQWELLQQASVPADSSREIIGQENGKPAEKDM